MAVGAKTRSTAHIPCWAVGWRAITTNATPATLQAKAWNGEENDDGDGNQASGDDLVRGMPNTVVLWLGRIYLIFGIYAGVLTDR